MEIPKPKSIIVCGILVLEENNAPAKTIATNIGIPYSRVSVVPPWLKAVTVLLVEAATPTIVVIISTLLLQLYTRPFNISALSEPSLKTPLTSIIQGIRNAHFKCVL